VGSGGIFVDIFLENGIIKYIKVVFKGAMQ